jgi:hypothetical protein
MKAKPDPTILAILKTLKRKDRHAIRAVEHLVEALGEDPEVEPRVECKFKVGGVSYSTRVIRKHADSIKTLAVAQASNPVVFGKKLRQLVPELSRPLFDALTCLKDYLAASKADQKDKVAPPTKGCCTFSDGSREDGWSESDCRGLPNSTGWSQGPCVKED